MEVTKEHNTNYFHLAGIVPVAGQKLDFNQVLPDCLMPIAPDYTLIEAAVVECAYAGYGWLYVCYIHILWYQIGFTGLPAFRSWVITKSGITHRFMELQP